MLEGIQLQGIGLRGIPFGSRLVAVNQLCFVRICLRLNNSLLIQRCGVGHKNFIVCFQRMALDYLSVCIRIIREDDMECAAVIQAGGHQSVIFRSRQSRTIQCNHNRSAIKCKAFAHGIVNHIFDGVAVIDRDLDFEIDGVAHCGIIHFFAIAIFRDFLDQNRVTVLFLNQHIRHCGIQRAGSAQTGLYKIVAQVKARKCNLAVIRSFGINHCNAVCCIFNCILRKIRCTCVFLPGDIALVVDINIVQAFLRGCKEAAPICIHLVVQCRIVTIVAIHIKNSVNGILLAVNGIVNGDAAGLCLVCERRRAQSQGQDQGQNQDKKLSRMFHCVFLPFPL